MTTVTVTPKHCRKAIAGDCFHCAVALALQEATGDDEANVYERDCVLYLEVWGRSIIAPQNVRLFVWSLGELPRTKSGRAKLPKILTGHLEPPTFTLPDYHDAEWQEKCSRCEQLCQTDELDGEGMCGECQQTEGQRDRKE